MGEAKCGFWDMGKQGQRDFIQWARNSDFETCEELSRQKFAKDIKHK